jgi:cell division protein FtsI/penicillin-binding protein 2
MTTAACEAALAQTDLRAALPCWRWRVIRGESAAGQSAAREALEREQRRYVDNRFGVTALPDPSINRALGRRYGLGSTFKIVIAAAYLDSGGGPDDLIDAPLSVSLAPTVVIHNAGGGYCPGADANRMISLRRALAVSCNTAFVQLARDLGWPAIAHQAQKFGFVIRRCGPADTGEGWLAFELVGSVSSCVPPDSDGVAIGNNALGGLDVAGTALGMATVMAAVANNGVAIEPTLVRSLIIPGTGHEVVAPARTSSAMSPEGAALLADALSETAVDGTAAGLQARVGLPLRVKTGTHERVPAGQPVAPGSFVRVDSWMIGFVRTNLGP